MAAENYVYVAELQIKPHRSETWEQAQSELEARLADALREKGLPADAIVIEYGSPAIVEGAAMLILLKFATNAALETYKEIFLPWWQKKAGIERPVSGSHKVKKPSTKKRNKGLDALLKAAEDETTEATDDGATEQDDPEAEEDTEKSSQEDS